MNTRVDCKSSVLTDVLIEIFKAEKLNLARIKFIGLFIVALSKMQTAGFEKLAVAFEGQTQTGSSLRSCLKTVPCLVLVCDEDDFTKAFEMLQLV